MKSKKLVLASLLAVGLFSIVILQSSAPPPPAPNVPEFEQQPPVVKAMSVQKRIPTGPTGENIILYIEYYPDDRLDDELTIYDFSNTGIVFHDDGVGVDATANDYIYTASYVEDLSAFKSKMMELDGIMAGKSTYTDFTGYAGSMVLYEPGFQEENWDHGDRIDFDPGIIWADQCDDLIKPQNSLFITDLSVVENGARTYNVVQDTGNWNGAWTFGKLMKNMAYQTYTGKTAKEFLKQWLKRWTDTTIINGQTVLPRTHVYKHLIGPWLQKANYLHIHTFYDDAFYQNSSEEVTENWEAIWNLTSQDSLLRYAPFKLMAIVNRMDLHGSPAYNSSLTNGGEIRFIFTLIAPFDRSGADEFPDVLAGMPPFGGDGNGGGTLYPCRSNLDWQGMNVILEYGVPITNRCSLRTYAQNWANLSLLTLGSSAYLSALEALTHVVIDSNAAPTRDSNNRSAINQVRTNERLFFESRCGQGQGATWKPSDWELSQFEIDNKLLSPAPVTNTPMTISNMPNNVVERNASQLFSQDNSSLALIDWLFGHKLQVLQGNHRLPPSYTYNGYEFKLAATAVVNGEQVHYWDLNWLSGSTDHYDMIDTTQANTDEKNIRLQFSLNTCQGCHAGENKTMFTMMRPRGYGQSANYWTNTDTPDYAKGAIDTRFMQNHGTSYVLNGNTEINNYTVIWDSFPSAVTYVPVVAPFLTGRTFFGNSANPYQDDFVQSAGEDLSDNLFSENNDYYIYEPSNLVNYFGDGAVPRGERYSIFNELKRRKQRLCAFISSACSPPRTFSIVWGVKLQPPPKGAH